MPMNLPSPDIALRLRQQAQFVNDFFGQDMTLRKFIGVSAGNPEFGIGDTWLYQYRPIRADMRDLTQTEMQMVGGQNYAGGYYFSLPDSPNERDEIIYPVNGGETFRIASKPVAEQIGANLFWGVIGLRAQVTGQAI